LFNGGPRLLEGGKVLLANRALEGWDVRYPEINIDNHFLDKKDSIASSDDTHSRVGFYHGWAVRRHPRTAVGMTAENIIYVAVVYGRQPKVSAGASVTEMARLMRQLKVSDAINLDGGGSSMMIIRGKKTGNSSDAEEERAVRDALIFIGCFSSQL
jgi:hypothetical protein